MCLPIRLGLNRAPKWKQRYWMTDKQQQHEKDRFITILVMKDAISEPFQLRLNYRKLKLAAYLIVCIPSFLLLSLLVTGQRCATVAKKNQQLYSMTRQYRASDQQLESLATELSFLEARTAQTSRNTQVLISGMSKDLKRYLPKGATGGGGGSEDEVVPPASTPVRPLSESQLARVGELEARLARLDSRLKSHDWTLKELEKSWEERNSVFTSTPSYWPIAHGNITSEFGVRMHPIIRRLHMHEGIDISSPYYTLIYASGQGIVTFASYRSGYGNLVIIDHGFGFSTHYGHCSQLLVSAGQAVKRGQPIAKVGSTGLSTGPHLHFEVRLRNVPVDPLDYVSIFSKGPDPG